MSSPHSLSHVVIAGMSAISPTPQLPVDGIEKSGTSRPAWRPRESEDITVPRSQASCRAVSNVTPIDDDNPLP